MQYADTSDKKYLGNFVIKSKMIARYNRKIQNSYCSSDIFRDFATANSLITWLKFIPSKIVFI